MFAADVVIGPRVLFDVLVSRTLVMGYVNIEVVPKAVLEWEPVGGIESCVHYFSTST